MFVKFIKIVLLLAVFAFAYTGVKAQSSVKIPLAIGDTVIDTGTASKFVSITGGYNGSVVQVNIKKLTGTAAGTIQLYGSLDGVTYVAIGSPDSITNVTTQAFIHYITNPLPQHLKVLVTGSGTVHEVVTVYYRVPIYQNH